jgi:hypothetical protein
MDILNLKNLKVLRTWTFNICLINERFFVKLLDDKGLKNELQMYSFFQTCPEFEDIYLYHSDTLTHEKIDLSIIEPYIDTLEHTSIDILEDYSVSYSFEYDKIKTVKNEICYIVFPRKHIYALESGIILKSHSITIDGNMIYEFIKKIYDFCIEYLIPNNIVLLDLRLGNIGYLPDENKFKLFDFEHMIFSTNPFDDIQSLDEEFHFFECRTVPPFYPDDIKHPLKTYPIYDGYKYVQIEKSKYLKLFYIYRIFIIINEFKSWFKEYANEQLKSESLKYKNFLSDPTNIKFYPFS